MENTDKGLTVPKWVLINRPKIPLPQMPKIYLPKPKSLGFRFSVEKLIFFSYETSISIRSMLQEVEWDYIVVDEGHRLKNKDCQLSIQLKVGKFQKQLVMPFNAFNYF